MKILLVGEYRENKLLDVTYDLIGFADKLEADKVMLAVGYEEDIPKFDGKLYLADANTLGEYNPSAHKQLVLDVVKKENPDLIVFIHSSFGWDLAPRVATSLKATQFTEVIDYKENSFIVPSCNSKLRRDLKSKTDKTVITIQAGAFTPIDEPSGSPEVENISGDTASNVNFVAYEEAEAKGLDLTKAEIIVTAGRGVGKKDNIPIIQALADKLGGELGASRPVADNAWVDQSHQVGTTGQTVSPKLYIACGVSGAIQHLAGMKKSEFIVAVNTDKDAPINEVADILVVADVLQFVPALTSKLS
ncbi:electron transfer flavoprotein subunit alpha/FixB family protein [Arcobacter roscoffensis]|uniref:Electron transfer flavoprotein subunit alpha/FixB family protein n=1 Tax=Arcobacter roscoffensis TaxID=2961520 RepID=A0ABY5E4A0_9BACT|nr:electron transfer flavoprotein subunit alpha/FixB family protein [Arcobacter roscoffensis]UTJ06570.1 electron transfer flavoprotein subunit alpha/FixB family protein [Arcobacter roscoffensis]